MPDLIIDGDGHLVEPTEIWHRYTDPALRADIQVESDAAGVSPLH